MIQRKEHRKFRAGQAGFSLLEMLVALAILSAAAYVALDTVESDTGQTRYQITENRLEKIRRAIVGNPDLVLNGSPVVSGYVADVGRLPECLEALLVRESECGLNYPAASAVPYQEVTGGLWMGWRGPYLTAPVADGLPDGWGNGSRGGVDYGWETLLDGNTAAATKTSSAVVVSNFDLTSWGRDRAREGAADTYDADQHMQQITPADYQVNLNLISIHVEISANRRHTGSTPPATTPERTKSYCVALVDINPADPSTWRLIPADANRDGNTDIPTTVTILENEVATTGPETIVFTANVENVTHGARPLVLYQATSSVCLNTGDEADLNDLSDPLNPKNPIVSRFGLVLSSRTPHAATFRTTFDFVEP